MTYMSKKVKTGRVVWVKINIGHSRAKFLHFMRGIADYSFKSWETVILNALASLLIVMRLGQVGFLDSKY